MSCIKRPTPYFMVLASLRIAQLAPTSTNIASGSPLMRSRSQLPAKSGLEEVVSSDSGAATSAVAGEAAAAAASGCGGTASCDGDPAASTAVPGSPTTGSTGRRSDGSWEAPSRAKKRRTRRPLEETDSITMPPPSKARVVEGNGLPPASKILMWRDLPCHSGSTKMREPSGSSVCCLPPPARNLMLPTLGPTSFRMVNSLPFWRMSCKVRPTPYAMPFAILLTAQPAPASTINSSISPS
mmetsp:Transcript_110790/g.320172  ORF Transcript_110790/g.320172 Transcript_110790/m.320172 type:complete len:240 (-) Transcript_110790:314-1033(-)